MSLVTQSSVQALVDKIRGSWRSKTVWFNALLAVVIYALPYAQDVLPQLAPYLADATYKEVMKYVLFGNLVLRFWTNLPLDAK